MLRKGKYKAGRATVKVEIHANMCVTGWRPVLQVSRGVCQGKQCECSKFNSHGSLQPCKHRMEERRDSCREEDQLNERS